MPQPELIGSVKVSLLLALRCHARVAGMSAAPAAVGLAPRQQRWRGCEHCLCRCPVDAVGSSGMTPLTTRGVQLCRESRRQLFRKLGEDACGVSEGEQFSRGCGACCRCGSVPAENILVAPQIKRCYRVPTGTGSVRVPVKSYCTRCVFTLMRKQPC